MTLLLALALAAATPAPLTVPVGENCRQWNAKGRVALHWPLECIGMVLKEHRLNVPHEWYIQEI